MQCLSCGAELTEILVCHNYLLDFDGAQGKWVKSEGDIYYRCGNCVEDLDIYGIESIFEQTNEL